MDQIDQREKTLVFCATQDHALAVRDLVNQMKTSQRPELLRAGHRQRRRARRTVPAGLPGQREERSRPILTTSQKLSTGVDARNIRNIVLMRPINSMIEFKQIIGRGTRAVRRQGLLHHLRFREGLSPLQRSRSGTASRWNRSRRPEPKPRPQPEPPLPPEGPEPSRAAPHRIKVKLADGKERTIQNMMATSFWTRMARRCRPSNSLRCCSESCPSSSRMKTNCAPSGARPTPARSC